LEGISAKATKKASDPAPVVVIGRLAVDKPLQGKGLGRAILKDALSRIVKASEMVDAKAVIVHAVDQEAVPFYARYGFHPFPLGNQTLYLTINEVIASL
jgi:predicted GNAT family N-acyltransferase